MRWFPAVIGVVFAAFQAHSQTVVTSASALWAGDVLSLQYADTSANESPAGAGQAWDFSDLVNDGLARFHMVVNPAQTGLSVYFPTASSAVDEGNGRYTFLRNTDTTMENVGLADGDRIYPYTDAELLFKYPFTYNDVYADTFRGTFDIDGVTVIRYGTKTFDCDGNGTLILPTGVISSTLRINEKKTIVDTAFYGNIEVVSTLVLDSYFWMVAANKNPLMKIIYATLTANGATSYEKTVHYYVPFVSSPELHHDIAAVSLFPNPATDAAVLEFTANRRLPVALRVTDVSGKEMFRIRDQELEAGAISLQLPLQSWPAGYYLVELRVEGIPVKNLKLLKANPK